MITYSKIGKKGHLGNQLFQIASTIGLAVKNNHEFSFFEWKYQPFFKNSLPLLSSDYSDYKNIEEKEYSYHEWNLSNENYDLSGWLQTEKYFDLALTKYYFEFSDVLIHQIKEKYKKAFDKRTILITIRRGDFVNHPDYFQLPINYYLNSLIQFFPDWQSCNLIVLSDDINYCKFHFSFLENVFFADRLNEIEQLCLGTLCDDFIISNSTFSWWLAWLGEKPDSKVIRPFKNFDGLKSKELNDKDYYPERWINYNHTTYRIELKNLFFFIKTTRNNKEIKEYISSFFKVDVGLNNFEVGPYKYVYVVNKDYFLPPLVIYCSYLKLKNTKNSFVVNSLIKSFKVSKKIDYKEFVLQKDFGVFSTIFSFQKIIKKEVKKNYNIYIKRSIDLVKEQDDFCDTPDVIIYFHAGEFCNLGGYKYSFRKYINRKKIEFKKSIKKMLSLQ